jgi:hypothetical protein
MTNTSSASASRRPLTDDRFTSNLGDGRQRFLSQVIAHALASRLRSAKDFIRHFPPRAIMLALASQPRLRANIIVPTIGLHEKVALKKSAESTGEDLQIALDEAVIDEDAIVRLFEPDDRVRYLDEKKLWTFLVEGDFWKTTASQASELAIAKQNLAYIVDCSRVNGLITDHDIVEGLTLDRILDSLPKSELTRLVRSAVTGGRHGRPFDDEALLSALPPTALLDHISLAQMWESVVLSRVALPHGFVVRAGATPPALPDVREEEEVVVEVVESESTAGKPPAAKGHRSRRIGASDLSEVKSEIEDRNSSKN